MPAESTSPLSPDYQTALDELIVACQESADHYRHAAATADADQRPLAAWFEAIAERRDQIAVNLAQHLTDTFDILPRLPDSDRETLDQLLVWFKSWLSNDARLPLLEQRLQGETLLLEKTDAVLTSGAAAINDPLRAVLTQLTTDARAVRSKLQSTLSKLTDNG